jgi:hypothetical protein
MTRPILQMRGRRVQPGRRLAGVLGRLACLALLFATSPPAAVAEYLTPVERAETPLFTRASPVGDIAYTPGRGLRVGDTGLSLGGYSSLAFNRDEGERAHIELEDVSLFVVADPFPRLHFFSEIEYEDVLDLDSRGHVGSSDDRLDAERLYADVTVTDALNIRTGIFLTPVGRWNVIHAAPLVWTTSRPLTTEKPFDQNVTGVMLFGSFFPRRSTLTYYVYDQFEEPIEGNPEFHPAEHSVGARLELTGDSSWSVGTSFLAARRGGGWRELGGLDLLWSYARVELMGEMVIADGAELGFEWGGYLQAAFALTPRLALVDRYEHYDGPPPAPPVNLIAFGLAYRPLPAVVLKAEYLIADRSAPDANQGVKASIATLF